MPIFRNAYVSSTRLDGTPVYTAAAPQFVQLDDFVVDDDPGLVELMPDSSSAMAPLLRKTVYDMQTTPYAPTPNYKRADIVTVLRGTGQPGPPVANPYHVLRVITTYNPLPATEVFMARVDMLTEQVTWFQQITSSMVGATPSPQWDAGRKQVITDRDGSFGVGWQLGGRMGYLAGQTITIAVNEYAISAQRLPVGQEVYESPVVIYEDPLVLSKGDLLVLPDGRRGVIADLQHRFQRMGVVLATLARLELRQPGDPLYAVS